jgi:hypothetical protein
MDADKTGRKQVHRNNNKRPSPGSPHFILSRCFLIVPMFWYSGRVTKHSQERNLATALQVSNSPSLAGVGSSAPP